MEALGQERYQAMLKSNWVPAVLSMFMLMVVAYILYLGDRPERWYSTVQLQTGKVLFGSHCASCHGLEAQGLIADWKQRDADGLLPPPPLNGSAHAWHHAMPLLLEIMQRGGSLYDGSMPAFGDVLNAEEQLTVIAYFQSYWDDETYALWQALPELSAIPLAQDSLMQKKRVTNEVQTDDAT